MDGWIASRMGQIEASGIRKIFELAKKLKDPINLSIGQPHFDVPQPIRQAAINAIESKQNGYTVTQGIPELRLKIEASVHERLGNADREVLITSGTSGGLVLTMMTVVNPGDEVILFDPYFVSYPHLVRLAGGTPVFFNTYPDFQIDLDRLKATITPKTKAMLVSSPGNPTGVCLNEATLRGLAEIAKAHGILLVSDEIYRTFWYDGPFRSASEFNESVLVLDGFGKSYSMTGWRIGFAHGPKMLIQEMAKLQQFMYVCAPSIVQHASVVAWDFDTKPLVDDYRKKRDYIYEELTPYFELTKPGGAFYAYPKVNSGTATEFISRAIEHNLLMIPGITFSQQDTHFRISFAATDEMLSRGVEILKRLSK
jgi:aspartate/methionine/tyrosine aminotransferase